MFTYVNEPEVKVWKRTPAVKRPARGLNSAPLIAYPDGRVGGKKIIWRETKKKKKNECNKHRKLYRRKAERKRDKRSQKRKMGKRKEMQVEK